MNFSKIEGLIAATFTPYTADGDLNLSMIPKYAQTLKNNGVVGAFIIGTTGEGASLTFAEKEALIHAWAPFNSDAFKVIAMVSGTSQQEGIELAKICQESGVYGISLNAPFYIKPGSVGQLVDFIRPIAEAAPHLPVYFYHIPLLTQVNLSMKELLKQAGSEIPNFAGIKYTHSDLMEFNVCQRYEDGKYDVLWGWDEMLLAGLAMGAKGGVGSTYNFAAPLYLQLIQAFGEGDLAKAKVLQERSIDFISLYPFFGGAAAGKSIMKSIGLDCGSLRSPGKALPESERAKLYDLLQKQDFFEMTMKSNSSSS